MSLLKKSQIKILVLKYIIIKIKNQIGGFDRLLDTEDILVKSEDRSIENIQTEIKEKKMIGKSKNQKYGMVPISNTKLKYMSKIENACVNVLKILVFSWK